MTYNVLLTKKDEKFITRVREWPEIVVEGETEEEALIKAQADLKSLSGGQTG
jgi:predicted RNase H-like HicB family nuclease